MTKKAEKIFNEFVKQYDEAIKLYTSNLCTLEEANEQATSIAENFRDTVLGMFTFKAISLKDCQDLLNKLFNTIIERDYVFTVYN